MGAYDEFAIMRSVVEYAKKLNQDTVAINVNDLDKLLNELEKEYSQHDIPIPEIPSEVKTAYYKAQWESILAQYNVERDSIRDSFRAVIQAGQSALKNAILINGGGAAALLAFLGHIWITKPVANISSYLPYSLLAFALGVLMAAIASGTTYLSQGYYTRYLNDKSNQLLLKRGDCRNKITIILIVFSYFLFLSGIFISFYSFHLHFMLNSI